MTPTDMPTAPTEGTLWKDTSVDPAIIRIFRNGKWTTDIQWKDEVDFQFGLEPSVASAPILDTLNASRIFAIRRDHRKLVIQERNSGHYMLTVTPSDLRRLASELEAIADSISLR